MSFGDLLKGKENTQLKARVAQLEAMLTPEMQDSLRLREMIAEQSENLAYLQQQFAFTQQKMAQLTADRLPRSKPKSWICVYHFQCWCLW